MSSHWRRPVRFNPEAKSWSCPKAEAPGLVRAFHRQLPDAQPTPLMSLDELAKELGVRAVYVKDESSRYDLPSFKILGASWGAYRAVTRELGLPLDSSIADVRDASASHPITLYSATDGNHGRAVARIGAILGTPVEIHVPAGIDTSTIEKIQSEGAIVVISSTDYDATVMIAHRAAQAGDGILIQDFAFDGYDEIPQWIVDGYQTMMLEIDEQLQGVKPDLVVTPIGVGSFAQAVVSHFKRAGAQTTVLAVEPDTAACFYQSVRQDKIIPIQTSPTIMTGLDCGTVSAISWPLLRSGIDASLTVSDFEAHTAVHDLQVLGVTAGPCGAASLAALRRLAAPDRERLGLTSEPVVALVQIDSSNPLLGTVPGPGETEIARYIKAWLEHRDIETHWVEPHPGRPSIVGVVRGSGGDEAKSLMFNGHIDTVTCLSYDGDALSGKIGDGKMYGRGVADMKGGVASALIALAIARTLGLRGDVIFTGVADEEATSIGTEDVLAAGWRADAAIVNEPTDLDIIHAHKGFVWFEVDILGVAAHGSRYDLGVDSISKAGYFLVALDKYAQRIQQCDGTGLRPSVHASIIKGGEEASSYPSCCTVTIERRTVKGETRESVKQEVQELLDEVSTDVHGFRYQLRTIFDRNPYELPLDHPFLTLVKEKVEKGTGKKPKVAREQYWTNCALLGDVGIPVLLLGPHGEGLHAKEEFAKVESLQQTTAILINIIKEFCK
ncbi:tryptophan synthase beta subunit-like PLP-dependent enzyme [Xylaria arbuscula]|nr:tryptophan synthase beta subunit-like PLP-dependent enzyme [Xylaria arbuscula]